jgi:hypothetical protein
MLPGVMPARKRGEVDEQLEGGARLARAWVARLNGLLVALAADHRDDAAVRPHRDQRHLRLPSPALRTRRDREPLESSSSVVTTAARHSRPRKGARVGEHPVGEIGAGRHVLHRPALQLHPRGSFASRLGEEAGVDHRLLDQLAALARALEVHGRGEARRRLHQAGQHRRLLDRQLLGRAAEIMVRRGAQAVDVVAEIDARQIAREDLVLVSQPPARRRDEFLQLAGIGAVGGQEGELGELLRDRAAALDDAAFLQVDGTAARRMPQGSTPL